MLPEIISAQHYVQARQWQLERDAARYVQIHGDQLPVRGPSLLSRVRGAGRALAGPASRIRSAGRRLAESAAALVA